MVIMTYKCHYNIPGEIGRFLMDRYGINPRYLDGYCFIVGHARRESEVRGVWIAPCNACKLLAFSRVIRRWGMKMLIITPKKEYVLTNTFAQVYGIHATRNIISINDKQVLENLVKKTFILREEYEGKVREINHDDYPYKLLKYGGSTLGLIKKHDKGYLSMLPEKFHDITYI